MFEYYAKVLKVVDGDTIDVMVDVITNQNSSLPFFFTVKRLKSNVIEHKEKGKLAKARVAELIPIGEKIIIKTEKDKRGKFGRYLAEIIILDDDETNLNDLLLYEGHAVL